MLELTLRLVASLALVVGLLLLVVRLGGRRFKGRASAPVRVVHRQALTRSSAVAIIEVGGRMIVVGATDQQVSMLTELDPDTLEDLGAEPTTPDTTAGTAPETTTGTPTDASPATTIALPAPTSSTTSAPRVSPVSPVPSSPAPAAFAPLPRLIQPVSTRPPAADSPQPQPQPQPQAEYQPAAARATAFDGASFAAHLDSAVRSLRPTTPPPASAAAVTASATASGAARAARNADAVSLLDLLDTEDVVEISSAGAHLAPTGTDAVVTALPVPVTPPAPAAPGARPRSGAHTAAQPVTQPDRTQPDRPRAGRRLATRDGSRLAPAPVRDDGPLAGSILSPGTWKQAAAAARGGRR